MNQKTPIDEDFENLKASMDWVSAELDLLLGTQEIHISSRRWEKHESFSPDIYFLVIEDTSGREIAKPFSKEELNSCCDDLDSQANTKKKVEQLVLSLKKKSAVSDLSQKIL